MNRIINSPVFIAISCIGIVDMVVQAITSGKVKLIRQFLAILFEVER